MDEISLTKEFFDRQEVDDTLQNIRKQYLESKKNLQKLVMMKQSPANTEEFKVPSIPKQKPPKPTRPSDIDEKLRRELRSSRVTTNTVENTPAPLGKETITDTLILVNEVRSMKNIIQEQRAMIRDLSQDLQVQRSMSYELQSKIHRLEAHIRQVELNMRGSKQPYGEYPGNDIFDTNRSNYSTTEIENIPKRSAWRTHSLTAPSSSSHSSYSNSSNMNNINNSYSYQSYSTMEDSTTRLIQLSNPK
ncbi:hypothetical protein Kpol_530p13 [Vanderwaltozyma polyspora DSM 70294]|uniref:Spindle pole component 29 n=1 Tax=Vanderwaltozyma polyspora (strain ATCC 22028 / DSM 70294 / BCRC 21397 / CBS 2163 / NBRC 10782 / NRRL Y-8283 / UCD 57-17) TaxID=436907 RepID=A7TKY7_VANPO|nr:uncharacterized protein Kpol_530p13 [Vanderwaltozyma polyspora DSM 70294]EDO17043.1 hypothetical protein Kpol_530p13 [Vanderwaltozyma polyspora DSM 70294]